MLDVDLGFIESDIEFNSKILSDPSGGCCYSKIRKWKVQKINRTCQIMFHWFYSIYLRIRYCLAISVIGNEISDISD